MDNKINGIQDNRLTVYRNNSSRIPSVTGLVIPEAVYTREEYEGKLLRNIYRDISPHDPEGILQYEWLNSRGAIARFDRMAIEIRILDIQECPVADLATAALITGVLKALTNEKWSGLLEQKKWQTERLNSLLIAITEKGGDCIITDQEYLQLFGFDKGPISASELWDYFLSAVEITDENYRKALNTILSEGSLSKRLVKAIGQEKDSNRIHHVYEELCSCLRHGNMFRP